MTVVAVLLAGAIMAMVRFGIARWAASRPRTSAERGFPAAVLIVNAVGSAVAGAAAGAAAVGAIPVELQTLILTGIAGGLTTYSTLNVETLQLMRAGRVGTAAANIGVNYAVGLGAAAVGYLAVAGAG